MADSERDSGTKDHAEGTGNELKGRAEQTWGSATGDRKTQGKGMVDEAKGKAQQGVGDLKDKVSDD